MPATGERRRRVRTALASAAALFLLAPAVTAGAGDPPARTLTVPDTLDGATAQYTFEFERFTGPDPVFDAVITEGIGTVAWGVDGAGDVTDGAGETQQARVHTLSVENFADFPDWRGGWQEITGDLTYALDPASGDLVRLDVDAEVQAPGHAHTTRGRFEGTYQFPGAPGLALPAFADVPVAFVASLAGRTFEEGRHSIEGPGPALFATAGAMEDGVLPLEFVLPPRNAVEIAGTVHVDEQAGFPAALELRYHDLTEARDTAVLRFQRVGHLPGGPLPDLPAFQQPEEHPEAEHAPPMDTGTRPTFHRLNPSVEDAMAFAETVSEQADYRAAHEDVFLLLGMHTRDPEGVGHLLPSDLAEAREYEHHWIFVWYSEELPADASLVWVTADESGEFGLLTAGPTPIEPEAATNEHPEQTLTVSSALGPAEEALPALRRHGFHATSVVPQVDEFVTALYTYLAAENLWLIGKGMPDVSADALLEGDLENGIVLQKRYSVVGTQLGACGYFVAPSAGPFAVVDGESGIVVAAVELAYEVDPTAADDVLLDDRGCTDPERAVEDALTFLDDLEAATEAVASQLDQAATFLDPSLSPRGPIEIRADADFEAPGSGVVSGSGTAQDPYVIEGWNIRFDEPQAATASAGVLIESTTKHVLVTGNAVHGRGAVGVHVRDAENVRLVDNAVLGLGTGVLLEHAEDGLVAENQVRDQATAGILVTGGSGVDIRENVLAAADGANVALRDAADVTVDGNDIRLRETRGLDAARSGNVRVTGNAIEGEGTGVLAEVVDDLVVAENDVLSRRGLGIVAVGGNGVAIADNVIREGSPGLLVAPGTEGRAEVPVRDLEISGNRVTTIPRGAVMIYQGEVSGPRGGPEHRITGNVFEGGHLGLDATGLRAALLAGNEYVANEHGLTLSDPGAGVVLTNETFRDAEHVGLTVTAGERVRVEGARFLDGEAHGILAIRSAIDIEGSAFSGNARGVVALEGAEVLVTESAFTGNGDFGAYAHRATIDARRNWWGAPNGPGGCGPGTGDRVSCTVSHGNWHAHAP